MFKYKPELSENIGISAFFFLNDGTLFFFSFVESMSEVTWPFAAFSLASFNDSKILINNYTM